MSQLGFGEARFYVGAMGSGKSVALLKAVFDAHHARSRETEGLEQIVIVNFKHRSSDRLFERSKDKNEVMIGSRTGMQYPAQPAESAEDIIEHVYSIDPYGRKKVFVSISDLQLFDSKMIWAIEIFLKRGYAVHAETLDTDFRGESFMFRDFRKHVSDLIEVAQPNQVRHLNDASCDRCRQKPAVYTQRLRLYTPEAFGTEAEYQQALRQFPGERHIPAEYSTPLIVPGAGIDDVSQVDAGRKENERKDFYYEARCKDCHTVPLKREFLLTYNLILQATHAGREPCLKSEIESLMTTLNIEESIPGIRNSTPFLTLMHQEQLISINGDSILLLRRKHP